MGVPISNVTRRVVFAASGTGPYAFTFEILAAGDIAVYKDDDLLTLTTDYTVTINANGTGSVTLASAPTGAAQIAIVGNRTIARSTDFVTGGDFFANTLNDELDQQTIFNQQNAEGLSRALQAPQTDPTTINMTLPRAADRAGKYLAFDANGNPKPGDTAVEVAAIAGISSEIQTVAGIAANVTTVANNDANVTTVAGISSAVSGVAAISSAVTGVNSNSSNINAVNSNATNINTVAGQITPTNNVGTVAGIAANVTTVAGNTSNINTVAGVSADVTTVAGVAASVSMVAGISSSVTTVATNNANVTSVAGNATNINTVAGSIASVNTVAGISANVTTVAGVASDITTVATNVADITNFADVYQGPKASDPTVRNDSSTLQAGDLYFNTAVDAMRVYDGAAWQTAYVSGSGFLASSNNLSDLASASTARTNLGLGSAATLASSAIAQTANNLSDLASAATARSNLGAQETLVSGTNIKTINGSTILGSGDLVIAGSTAYGLFRKADPTIVAWTKTGAGTATTSTTLYVEVNGSIKTIASGTSITMPTLSAGTDYAIWAKTDGTLEATSNHTSPPTANARKVGGFHYAPGGNATGVSGGDSTPAINAYSFWDLKFRPVCSDPRGMTLVANSFWADIYLCGVDHYTNGTSKYNVTIADGSSLPKISAAFGGNGSNTYAGGTWFAFNEIMQGVGKRLPAYTEACAFAYGTTEASSGGTDPGSTILRAAYTSKWGVMLASGNMWQWLRDFIASGDGTGGWQTGLTETRGDIYTYNSSARAGIFGGSWAYGAASGSRCSFWGDAPSVSVIDAFGARGVCDHLQLD